MNYRRAHYVLAGLFVLLMVAGAVLLYRSGLWVIFTDPRALQSTVRGLGPWGPVGIILAQIAQVVLAPIPGQVVGIAAGYLYGVFWGIVLSLIGLMLGTLLAVWLARILGRPVVERLAGADTLSRLDGYAERRGPLALLFIYLLPFLPDDMACFAAGLSPIPIRQILLVAVIGRSLGLVVSSWLGAHAHTLTWPYLAAIAALTVAGAVVIMFYHRRLEDTMFRLLDHLYSGK
jgi:uncharacterized membrane protein YdjX (TVP38/TMEM64 family)